MLLPRGKILNPLVYILDDDADLLNMMEYLFQSVGIQTAAFREIDVFFAAIRHRLPDGLIIDLRMPNSSGLQVLRDLEKARLFLPSLLHSAYGEGRAVAEAMQLGAVDFVPKPASEQQLIDAVQSLLRKAADFAPRRAAQRVFAERLATLTPRERDVLEGVMEGHSSKEIARELNISPKTVELYRAQIMAKMKADNVALLVHYALIADPTGFKVPAFSHF